MGLQFSPQQSYNDIFGSIAPVLHHFCPNKRYVCLGTTSVVQLVVGSDGGDCRINFVCNHYW
jgi:hypothetical protein